MSKQTFDPPFDGAITKYFDKSAPKAVRDTIIKADKKTPLSKSYPYKRELNGDDYDETMAALQIELAKLQAWTRKSGERIAIVFEGRDAAGKGGAIKRFRENLNPRGARVAALPKPSDAERSQWYFQRYVAHLPTAGEIVFFDRSWYNRGVVETVFGFCSADERETFFKQAPAFETMLTDDGIHLFKLWLTVGRAEQLRRFLARSATRSNTGSSRVLTWMGCPAGTPTHRRSKRRSLERTTPRRLGACFAPTTRSARGLQRSERF